MPDHERMYFINALANAERLLGLVLRVLREARQKREELYAQEELKAPPEEARQIKRLKTRGRRRGRN